MNKRQFAALAALALGAVLLFVGIHQRGHSLLPTVGTPATAQAPDDTDIVAKAVPSAPGVVEDWHRYEFTVPPTSPPLDMHVVFFIDGKGDDTCYETNTAWKNPVTLRYQLSDDDDTRVKTILKAQGFPVNDQLVTYHYFEDTSSGGEGFDQTLKFSHGPGGDGESTTYLTPGGPINKAIAGQKIMLSDAIISDSNFHQANKFLNGTGRISRFPINQVHRMTLYVQFQQHKGTLPPGHQMISNAVSRATW